MSDHADTVRNALRMANEPGTVRRITAALAALDALEREIEIQKSVAHGYKVGVQVTMAERDRALRDADDNGVLARGRLSELNAAIAERDHYKAALEHYANEDHWTDSTPPESVNTALYLVWEYDGGEELPWAIARAALSVSGRGAA